MKACSDLGLWRCFLYSQSVHITTKRQISTYRNRDLSLSDEILKYGDFDLSKSDAWTKFVAISEYSTPSSYHGFLSFRYSDIWWLKAIAKCRYSTDCATICSHCLQVIWFSFCNESLFSKIDFGNCHLVYQFKEEQKWVGAWMIEWINETINQ